MMSGKKTNLKDEVLVLVGPTSSGKTALALELCKENGGVIVSADSRQIYKFMDVGTGKIPIGSPKSYAKKDDYWEIEGVKIFGYDLATLDQYFTAYDYGSFALKKIAELLELKQKVIVVGGTGLYIDILTGRRKLDGTAPDPKLRFQLETLSLDALLEKLHSLNRAKYEEIDKSNRRRVLRAVEKELATNTNKKLPLLENVIFKQYGLIAPNQDLYIRVDSWVETIWDALLKETSDLEKKYPNNIKLRGLVYKSALAYLQSAETAESAKQRAKWDLHSYIRRQLTWFKKNPDIIWLNISQLSQKDCILRLRNI